MGRAVGDVVAAARRDGDEGGRPDADLVEEGAVLLRDAIEDAPVPAHEIHLVDHDGELADAEQ